MGPAISGPRVADLADPVVRMPQSLVRLDAELANVDARRFRSRDFFGDLHGILEPGQGIVRAVFEEDGVAELAKSPAQAFEDRDVMRCRGV